MVLGEINGAFDDPIIVHLHKIALADLLISGNEVFTVCAADLQDMAAPHFFAVWVRINFHKSPLYSVMLCVAPIIGHDVQFQYNMAWEKRKAVEWRVSVV